MRSLSKKISFFFIVFVFIASVVVVNAQTTTPTPTSDESQQVNDLQKRIRELESKVSDLRSQGNTLSSQIQAMDSQITLTETRINATEQQITDLVLDIDSATKRMENLETSLHEVTKTLINRIVATYQIGGAEPMQVLLSSNDVNDFVSRANYLRIVQAHDKKLLYDTQQARNDYANQKLIFEDKKKKIEALNIQLEAYNAQLEQDKNTKEALLKVTQNNELKYQDLLARARSEYAAIQGIIAGDGTETLSGNVSEGARIASVISGASCNSSGGHLHFIVRKNGSTENPFSNLKSIDSNNCSGSSCGSGDGDAFNPSGSWEWPLSGPITLHQGYGSTWATRNTWTGRIYSFHNGIDINGSSNEVKAVKSGTLYRGSYSGSGGCRLPYVRLRHEDGIDTFYLHVFY